MPPWPRTCLLALGVALAAITPSRAADTADDGISQGRRFQERDGASLYRAICQGCHMADGQGARGAGAYPALADSPRVAAAPYLIVTIVRGRNGMPPFGAMLDDEQVAAVASHVRTHFGNRSVEPVSGADVRALR
jgi:mono/diheme cytochrome c family protein